MKSTKQYLIIAFAFQKEYLFRCIKKLHSSNSCIFFSVYSTATEWVLKTLVSQLKSVYNIHFKKNITQPFHGRR